jgi:PAS domain S-box-containing protein
LSLGKLIGILYLENNLTTHAFTAGRIQVLEMLLSQTAISLENARIYKALKESGKKLKENEEWMQLALESANIGLFDFNIQDNTLLVDDGWLEMLGYSPDEIKIDTDTWWSWIHPDDQPRQVKAFQDHLEGRSPYYHLDEYRARGKSGDWVWLLDHGKVVEYDSDGRPLRLVGIHLNINERKRAEEKICTLNLELEQRVRDRTAQLEAANKELEAFAYTVSHDLRAPLRHIDGFLELLQKEAGSALNEQSRHYMDTIFEATKKMGLLIDDLISFSRMGRHALSLQQVEMRSLVREVIRELEPDATGRAIEWRISDLPLVNGDKRMLRIVLTNLISNALKFTRSRPQARIEIGSLPDQDSQSVIFVRDNGVGFDMAYAKKLFGVFQRLHRADDFEGTGIGLAIVRRIIARHGGRTWAQGEPDRGAAFYFTLPRT